MANTRAPFTLLMIIAVVFTFQLAITDQDIVPENATAEVDNPKNQTEDDGFLSSWTPDVIDMLAAIIGTVWNFLTLFFKFLTFDIEGAPNWVRFIIGITLNGTLGWSIVALIRGSQ